MRLSRTGLLIVATMLFAAGWLTTRAFSQGSGSSRTDPPRATRPQTPEEFLDSFWRFLVKKDAAYNTWTVLKRDKADDGINNPHSDISKTYANKVAADNPASLPDGSVLVREDYDAEKKRLSISVMYRVKDYNKDHGNWYWIKYLDNGTVVRTSKDEGNKPISGKVASCIECHAKAAGKDYVFSNPAPTEATGKGQP